MMPEILRQLEKVPGLPVDVEIARAIGGIPTSYFKYYYHSNRVFEKQKAASKVRAEELMALQDQVMTEFTASKSGLPDSLLQRGAHWYGASVVPVMLAHANNAHEVHIVNLPNGTTLDWMPAKAIIETPALVSAHGFSALHQAETPLDLQAMVRLNATFEILWVEAVVEKDYSRRCAP